MKEANYRCSYCQHRFVHEERFMKHTCEPMKREKMFQEPLGQAAWSIYQKWMKTCHRPVSNAKAFISSRYFNTLIKFAEFVKRSRVVDVDVYIKLMCEHDILPALWTNEQVHNVYLEHLDRKLSAVKHAEITARVLMDWAEDHGVDVSNVFSVLTAPDVIRMVRERRLSPWILLHSTKFGDFVVNNTNPEQRIILESLIRPAFWKKKFVQDPKSVCLMKKLVQELKL